MKELASEHAKMAIERIENAEEALQYLERINSIMAKIADELVNQELDRVTALRQRVKKFTNEQQ